MCFRPLCSLEPPWSLRAVKSGMPALQTTHRLSLSL